MLLGVHIFCKSSIGPCSYPESKELEKTVRPEETEWSLLQRMQQDKSQCSVVPGEHLCEYVVLLTEAHSNKHPKMVMGSGSAETTLQSYIQDAISSKTGPCDLRLEGLV